MDDTDQEFQELEIELRRLRPLASSARLKSAVERQITTSGAHRARRRLIWWMAVPVGAAAAVALAWIGTQRTAQSSSRAVPARPAQIAATTSASFHPVEAEAIPLGEQTESYGTLADGTLVRGTRETYLTKITWRDPKTRAQLTWSVPREEVRVEPVLYQ